MDSGESRRAIILGASSGIGREMALWLAGRGWRVGITGRREALLGEVAESVPGRIVSSVFDVNDVDALPGRMEELTGRLGGLDLVVISAGTGFLNPGLAVGPEEDTVATNVAAFTAASVWAFNYFKQRGGGHIAAITSVAGLLGAAEAPAYSASKAYQILYLDGLRKRAKKENPACAITELRPGSVDTAMMKGEGHFWISRPAAADLACRAIMKRKKRQYISRRWSLIGLILRLVSVGA